MTKDFNPIDLELDSVLPRLDAAKMVWMLALKRVLPQSQPLISDHEGLTFRALFTCQGPLPPLFLTLMQEEMRRIKKEALPLRRQEMLRSNAASFLRHHGLQEKAAALEEGEEGVIPLIRLGDALDEPFSPDCLEDTSRMGVVQLLSFSPLEEGVYETVGTAFEEEKEAKSFLKLYKEEMKRRVRESFIQEGLIVSPLGVERRDRLFASCRTAWKEFHFHEVALLDGIDRTHWGKIAALFPKGVFWTDLNHDEALLLCPKGREKTEMHHVEQFVSSWLKKMNPSRYEKIEGEGRWSWFLIDRLGVRYQGPEAVWLKELGLIRISLIGHLESWLSV